MNKKNRIPYTFTVSCMELIGDPAYKLSERVILNLIIHHLNVNDECVVDNDYLARRASCKIQSLKNMLTTLCKKGLIQREMKDGVRNIFIPETSELFKYVSGERKEAFLKYIEDHT